MNPSSGTPLDDPTHETACQLRVSGKSQREAYAEAFEQADESEANNSSRFFRQPQIKARCEELRRWRSAMANLDEAWVLVQLKAVAKNAKLIGNANLDDYFAKGGKDGKERLGISLVDVPRAKMAALEEVTIDEYTEGRGEDAERIKRTKIKLKSAQSSGSLAALELLGKHLGMWPSKLSASLTGEGGGPIEVTWKQPGASVPALENTDG